MLPGIFLTIGIILLVGGIGYTLLALGAAAMSSSSNNEPTGAGKGIIAFLVGAALTVTSFFL